MTERSGPPRAVASPWRRRRALTALLAAGAAAAAPTAAHADATTTFDRTYTTGGDPFHLDADGLKAVDVTAVGGWGGPMHGLLGGRPDVVSGRVILPDRADRLYVYVGGNGGVGTSHGNGGGFNGGGAGDGDAGRGERVGGGGGGASDVRLDPSLDSRLLVAAGGGGAGARAGGSVATGGGAGGDAGAAGRRAPSVTPENTVGSGGYGGQAATARAGGAGGDRGFPYGALPGLLGDDGRAGALGAGGAGGAPPTNAVPGGGGGGGGGLHGGGGGGAGALMSWPEGGNPSTGGGGGGGGSSLVPPGGTRAVVDATSGTPSIRIAYTRPGTVVTGPGGFSSDREPQPAMIVTADRRPAFSLHATQAGSTFDCRGSWDGAWAACPAAFVPPPLDDGVHAIAFRAVNADGNTDPTPVLVELLVDTVAPTTTIADGPIGATADARPAFAFAADEPATFACRFDDAPFAPCSEAGRHRPAAALPAGPHTFAVRATDLAGNVGPAATRTFTVLAPDRGPGGGGDGGAGPGGNGGDAGGGPAGGGDGRAGERPAAISRLSVARRIRAGRALPRRTSRAARAAIAFTLSADAVVTLSFERERTGRRTGRTGRRACVAPSRRTARAPRCRRHVRVPGAVTLAGRRGRNRFVFRGRLARRRALAPGTYRLTARLRRAGADAAVRRATFTLLRPAR